MILDIKYAATAAIRNGVSETDRPWLESSFANDGQRAIEAQRQQLGQQLTAQREKCGARLKPASRPLCECAHRDRTAAHRFQPPLTASLDSHP